MTCSGPTTNSISVKLGRSRRLNPSGYLVRLQGDTLILQMNLDNRVNPWGCGRALQFALCESEALSMEQQAINEIAEDMTRREEQNRSHQIQRAQERNQQITQDNERAQKDYQRKMEEYHKMINEKCNYSQCTQGYSKCGVCNGRGHNTNNNHTSECSSCRGAGKRPCNNCNGTMKRHQSVNLPSAPNARSLEPIPTFGSLPNYRDQI